VRDGEGDLLPGLLADSQALESFEEGALFGADWLRSLGMIPNEYLFYFYFAAETVAAIAAGDRPRAAYLLEQQAGFYSGNGGAALPAWRAARREREQSYMAEARGAAGVTTQHAQDPAGGYEGEALAVVEAISRGRGSVLICNTANRSALPFLDERAVVEVPAVVGAAGRSRSPSARCRSTPARSCRPSRRSSEPRSRPRSPARPRSRSRRWRCIRSCPP
jgi:6-phospho-beta-glucosidase